MRNICAKEYDSGLNRKEILPCVKKNMSKVLIKMKSTVMKGQTLFDCCMSVCSGRRMVARVKGGSGMRN